MRGRVLFLFFLFLCVKLIFEQVMTIYFKIFLISLHIDIQHILFVHFLE